MYPHHMDVAYSVKSLGSQLKPLNHMGEQTAGDLCGAGRLLGPGPCYTDPFSVWYQTGHFSPFHRHVLITLNVLSNLYNLLFIFK